MRQFIAKVKVIASAAVTWLTFASIVLTTAAEEVAALLPTDSEITATIIRIVAWLSTAILIIRRVATVLPNERGILPQGPPPPALEPIDAPIDEGAQNG